MENRVFEIKLNRRCSWLVLVTPEAPKNAERRIRAGVGKEVNFALHELDLDDPRLRQPFERYFVLGEGRMRALADDEAVALRSAP